MDILKKREQEESLTNGFKDVNGLLCKISRLYNVGQDMLIEMKIKEVRETRSIFMYLVEKMGISVKNLVTY